MHQDLVTHPSPPTSAVGRVPEKLWHPPYLFAHGTLKERRDAIMLAFYPPPTLLYMITHKEGKVSVRLELVNTCQACGSLRKTARRQGVSRHTVRKRARHH